MDHIDVMGGKQTANCAYFTCFRCFFSSVASGSGKGGRISALLGAMTCDHTAYNDDV